MTPEERLRQLLEESVIQADPLLDARILDDARKAYAPARGRSSPYRMPMLAATVLVMVGATSLWWAGQPRSRTLLEQIQAGRLDAGPVSPADPAAERLLDRTDPQDLGLMAHIHAVTGDPLMMGPHSVWDQNPPLTSSGRL